MAKGRDRGNAGGNGGQREVASDYRHPSAKRKNNPPATPAAEGVVPAIPKARYSYSPRLRPAPRFDPNRSVQGKTIWALNVPSGVIDAERVQALSGRNSLPFSPGKHRCAAVKVIDPRGNEVMQVHKL
jgi:hypothetical protein